MPQRMRRARDRGSVILTSMLLMLMCSIAVIAIVAGAARATTAAAQSRDLIEANQLADKGMADGVDGFTQAPAGPFPTQSSPKTATDGQGTWSWYADPVTAGPVGQQSTVHSTGQFLHATKTVAANVGSLQVGGFKVGSDGNVGYELSPATAFRHVVFGPQIQVQNGINAGPADQFITGPIGVTGATLNLAPYPTLASNADTSAVYLYGSGSNAVALNGAVRVPAGAFLDPKFVSDNLARCTTGGNWVASQNGGLLVANGNTGCYTSMVFDVPTTVTGAGAAQAFVSGNVTFQAPVTVPAGTALNIYTNGSTVEFDTEMSPTPTLTVQNTFIYAPNANCRTQPFRSTISPLDFTGSLACGAQVQVAGKLAAKAPVNPLGSDLYGNTVWFQYAYKPQGGQRR